MKMTAQRLRNLTTGKLHTKMAHIYEDLGAIIGEEGLMTHMLPRVLEAVTPWLQEQVKDQHFWDGAHDQEHIGEVELPEPSEADRAAMLERFKAMPNPLDGRKVITEAV